MGAPVRPMRVAALPPLVLGCLLPAPADARAQDDPGVAPDAEIHAVEEFYTLDEPELSGVIERLNAMRLDSLALSQGLTEYRIRPEWRPVARDGACRVGALRIRARIVVTLPRWSGASRATADEQSRWARIFRAIQDHEYEHRDLTIEAARALTSRLSELEASGCGTLRRAVQGELSLADERLKAAHQKLDEATPERLIGD